MKIKRTKKGFTLIELLIVLAIFSIILMLVMSFIDPVSRLMTKTSVRERTAAYVDNIGDYVDKSVRYAKFVRVYKGEYGDRSDTALPVITEQQAVQAFADDFFDGALKSDNTALTGNIRVLKLYNDNMPGADDKPGVAYESEYTFVAGNSCRITHDFDTGLEAPDDKETKNGRVFDGETATLTYGSDSYDITCPGSTGDFPRATVTKQTYSDGTTEHMILNPEHFIDYSYYYTVGYNELDPVLPGDLASYEDAAGDPLPTSEKFYYSRLVPMKQNDGSDMSVSASNFCLSVVSYQNNAKGVNRIDTEFSGVDPAVPVTLFKSPSYISSASMTLKNCVASGLSGSTLYEKYFRLSQTKYTGSGTVSVNKDSEGNNLLEAIDPKDYYGPTFEIVDTAKANSSVTSENIYIIYALPDEVSPSPIKYGAIPAATTPATTTATPT